MRKEDIESMERLRKVGIDTEMGLKRVANKEYLYLKLLKSLVNGTLYQALEIAVSSGCPEKILAAAHAIKGVCAHLAIGELQQQAGEIERHARNKELAEVEECFRQFSVTYKKVAAVIKSM